jgi:hypothetical protein
MGVKEEEGRGRRRGRRRGRGVERRWTVDGRVYAGMSVVGLVRTLSRVFQFNLSISNTI